MMEKNCTNCAENIRHYCIKFSCLGGQAPEICAPLFDTLKVEKQDQHFFHFRACHSWLFWSGRQACA
jgi:hypothetical protein